MLNRTTVMPKSKDQNATGAILTVPGGCLPFKQQEPHLYAICMFSLAGQMHDKCHSLTNPDTVDKVIFLLSNKSGTESWHKGNNNRQSGCG